MVDPAEEVKILVEQARQHAQQSSDCSPPLALPYLAQRLVLGWSLCADVYRHGDVEHWRVSAKLFPPGRGSTEADWGELGEIVATITDATGYPKESPFPEPLTPIATTHPNATLHWMWHADGSPVDAEVLAVTSAILARMTPGDPMAYPVHGKDPPRNDPRPCGSGRKFKKCHGGN